MEACQPSQEPNPHQMCSPTRFRLQPPVPVRTSCTWCPEAPLSEYLSLLALRVVLENIGCPAEAYALQLRLSEMAGKDNRETLVLQSEKHSREEGIGNNVVILRHLMPSPGDVKRVRHSVTLPEACTSKPWLVLYEMAQVLVEMADKLPPIDLVREFKASAVNVTQQCTIESWGRTNELASRLMSSPELTEATIPVEDRVYFVARLAVILKHIFLNLAWEYFQTYFG